jgi:hypothetical protein
MGLLGVATLVSGVLCLILSTRGQRDWYEWKKGQRVGALAAVALIITGLLLMDLSKSGAS